ncbi:hypothetical protein JOD31_003497 [Methylopila capsulata]|uniref:Membrane protein n=1 Tax=Methylopila capsulata TaxID=61654 RepID=A0A9W6IYL0_9HYPH|nr:DUF6644 family protein [Methylopila capsulata]MBM7853246.1 hypothetical protein [Methylopila capsulata]GLK57540.1 membrane protein [Methylopila capsulata]
MDAAGAAPVWAAALEASALGAFMRGASAAYPIANLGHLLGLTLLVGSVALLDLRLLGAGRRLPAHAVSQVLTSTMLCGAGLLVVTGGLLFAADARALIVNGAFLWKLGLVAAACANAVLFHVLWRGALADWDETAPRAARVQAAASIALWLTVAALGRLIAYV